MVKISLFLDKKDKFMMVLDSLLKILNASRNALPNVKCAKTIQNLFLVLLPSLSVPLSYSLLLLS